MDLRRLPPTERAVERFVERLFVPFHRDLEDAVEEFALAEDVDHVAAEVPFLLDQLGGEDARVWVAVDDASDEGGGGDGHDSRDGGDDGYDGRDGDDADDFFAGGEPAGFVKTGVDAAPPVFDRPDRLVIGDLYVREPYRGTGLARRLTERAAADADAAGCPELALDVDVGNERAVAFYEKLGIEPARERRIAPVDSLR